MTAAVLLGRARVRLAELSLSRRERGLLLGLLLLASLVWAVTQYEGAQAARDIAEEAQASLRIEEARQARLASPGFTRAVGEEAAKVRLWSLDEPTVYIAQMRAQSQLEDFAIAAGVANPEIVVERPDPPQAGVQRLFLQVEGDFDWTSFLAFLSYVERAEASYRPVSAEVTTASVPARFSVVLAAAYISREGRR